MSQNTKQNVASQMVDAMAESGIKNIYAITGDSLNALTDTIVKDGRIKFIHMRHEESAAFAADAEAQLTGHLACCAGSSGPGHIHLINGLYDAQRSNAPVLAIASTCPSPMFGTGYFQETNPGKLFADCSVYNETACNAPQAARMLPIAMQEAVSKGGVAVFGMPEDVLSLDAVDSGAAPALLPTQRVPEASEEEIEKVADIFNSAVRPVIFAGSGCAKASELLNALAAKLNAPVATTFKSQLELTGNCPNYIGHMGYLGMWSAIKAVAGADAILIIGTNFPFPGFFPEDSKIVQVDIRASRIGRKAKVGLGVRADAGEFLTALLPKISPKSDRSYLDSALADYAAIEKKDNEPVASKGVKGAIRPEYFFSLLNDAANDDAVFTVDTGMNCLWASHYLKQTGKRAMIGSFTHGSMANALPQSIGCQVAQPRRQVIALSGDGGLAMLMGELLTVVQYNLPVKIFVADNRALAYVRWEMELAGIEPNETSLTNPDFGKMAEVIGFQAETVDDPDKLKDAIDRWLSAPGPALLSVTTQTDAASFNFSQEMMKNASADSSVSNFVAPGSI